MSHPQGMFGRCWEGSAICHSLQHSLVKVPTAQIRLKSIISACLTFFSVSYCQNSRDLPYLLTPLSKGDDTVLTVFCDLWLYSVQLSNEDLNNQHVQGTYENKALLQYSLEQPRTTKSKLQKVRQSQVIHLHRNHVFYQNINIFFMKL